MALNKVNYVDNQTIITAQNLNNIQDCVIALQKNPRNLLDNSDFRNPINQREQTSYNLLQGSYGIDRWIPLNVTGVKNTVELTDNGIIFGNETNETVFLTQRFEKGYLDSTKTYTTVECFEDGTISFGGYIDFSSAMNCDIVNLTFPANTKIKWVALYEGEYTIDTLPEYQPKGYAAELAECQRYFNRYTVKAWSSLPVGKNEGGDNLQFKTQLNFPPLRTTFPSVTVSCPGNLQVNYVDGSASPLFTADDIVSCISYSVGYNTRLELRGIAVLTDWKFGALTALEHDCYIDFSSDL